MVYMEDLKIKNMSKSAKGTAEEHGKNVAAKSGLNRSILDCGWGNFGTMLEYKTEVLKVNPKHTSQICSYCGHKDAKNRLSQSKFVCTSCAHTSNADVNAAKNILSRGTALYRQREALACA
jgi:putative transposase